MRGDEAQNLSGGLGDSKPIDPSSSSGHWGDQDSRTAASKRAVSSRDAGAPGAWAGARAILFSTVKAAPTVFGDAYAVLWQGSNNASLHLVGTPYTPGGNTSTTVASGPAFYYDRLQNVNGSTMHSPGERAGASMASLPYISLTNTDAILFGGLTMVNKSINNNQGEPFLSNDVHYLQYLPSPPLGVSLDTLPQPRFPACPVMIGGWPYCKSVSVFSMNGSNTATLQPFWEDLTADAPQPQPQPQQSPQPNPYPFNVSGRPNLLRSYELQLAYNHDLDELAMPKGRMWHASCFVDTKNISSQLGFGRLGLLVIYGGVMNYQLEEIAPETEMLEDLWVFDLEHRRWSLMTGGGVDSPGKRLRHSMHAKGTVIFLTGGYTYDSENAQWQYDSRVYYMDLQLGLEAVWINIDGDSQVLGKKSIPTTIAQGMGVSRKRSHLVTLRNEDIVFVPMPVSTEVDGHAGDGGSGGGASENEDSGTSAMPVLETVINKLYDSDLLVLPEDTEYEISGTITVEASVVFYGRAGIRAANRLLTEAHSGSGDYESESRKCESDDCSSPAMRRMFQFEYESGFVSDVGSRSRISLAQSEVDAALQGRSAHLLLISGPEAVRTAHEAGREALEASRRVMQAVEEPPTSGLYTDAFTVNVSTLLATSRTRIICSRPNSTILVKSGAKFINMDFMGCQLVVANPVTEPDVTLVNCVIRDTLDRPAILVRPGGRVSIKGSILFNNTYTLPATTNISGPGGSSFSGGQGDTIVELVWGAGAAIYVMPRGSITEISSSVFIENGNGKGTTRGGAIYLAGPGSCLNSVINCTFLSNGRQDALSPGGGGAVAGYGPDGCNLTIRNSSFIGNAAEDGGAVYLAQMGVRSVTLIDTRLYGNQALASGGALHLGSILGQVTLVGAEVVGNTARDRGGGVSLEGVQSMAAEGLLLQDNVAQLGMGGGLAHLRQGLLKLTRANITGNRAVYGGGVSGGQDLEVELADSDVSNNTALVHAGGMECYQCYKFTALSTNFSHNTAPSGGGLVLTQTDRGGALESVTFTNNTGLPTNGSSKIDQAACARDGQGGGGGLCLVLRGSVSLRNVHFHRNTAVAGGGVFLQQHCLSGDTGCGPAVLERSTFVGNMARGGGGGALFRNRYDLANVTCPGDTQKTPWDQLHNACESSWLWNTALYGNVTATIAYNLSLLTPDTLERYRSNDPLSVVVALRDFHGQLIEDGTREALTSLEIASATSGAAGALSLTGNSISSVNGVGNFTRTLRLQARPGNYSLTVRAPRTIHDVPPVIVKVTVRQCVFGEVTNREGTLCYPCDPNTFSLNTSALACNTCPKNANCSVIGYPWVTLPKAGYWHSGPRSPHIIPCVYKDACKGTKDWPRQDNMANYLKRLDKDDLTFNLTEYYDLQCAEGYCGNLCGRCEEGYGRMATGRCARCASRVLNAIYYVLSLLINIFFIYVTVRGQLPDSLTSQRRLQRIAEEEARFQRCKELSDKNFASTTAARSSKGSLAHSLSEEVPPSGLAPKAMVTDKDDSNEFPKRHSSALTQEQVAIIEEIPDGPYKGGNHGIVIKILMSYLQVSSMVRSISGPWPSIIVGLFSSTKAISNSSRTLVSIDCSLKEGGRLPMSVQRVIIYVITPFAILAFAVLLSCGVFAWLRFYKKSAPIDFGSYLRPRLIITTVAIIFYVYIDITNILLSLFSCPTLDPTNDTYSEFMLARARYWSEDPNLKCYVKQHLALVLALGVPGVALFSVGAPVISWLWLKTHQDLMYTSPEFGVAYGFIYEDYKRASYFWESMIMLRKLAVVVVIVFLQPQGALIQVIAVLGVILLSLMGQVTLQPYKCRQMDRLERLSLYAMVALLYCALLFVSEISGPAKMAVGIILLLFNMAVIAFFVWQILREFMLGLLWDIDDQSNADGVLEWSDIWAYVDKVHSNKWYTTLLIKALRLLEHLAHAFHRIFVVPATAIRDASSRFGSRFFKININVQDGGKLGSGTSVTLLRSPSSKKVFPDPLPNLAPSPPSLAQDTKPRHTSFLLSGESSSPVVNPAAGSLADVTQAGTHTNNRMDQTEVEPFRPSSTISNGADQPLIVTGSATTSEPPQTVMSARSAPCLEVPRI